MEEGCSSRSGILVAMAIRCMVVGLGAIALVGLRRMDSPATRNPLLVHGLMDETGHLLTATMLAIGVLALRFPIPVWSVLVGGVLLDVGHILTALE